MGRISVKRLLMFGVFTLSFPLAEFFVSLMAYSVGFFYYIGPIPIQFVVLLILLYIRGNIVIERENESDESTK